MLMNQAVIVASRPEGIPQASNFSIVSRPLDPVGEQQILVKNAWVSVEPAMRGWLSDKSNYSAPIATGDVMRSLCVGTVMESRSAAIQVGDTVLGWFGWQQYATVSAGSVVKKIEDKDLPLSLYLGILGLNGVTAATALYKIGAPKAGDVVVVSTAAGGVGSCVGQLAKRLGCTTIGITSTEQKANTCQKDFGYDHVINYKQESVEHALSRFCTNGVDIYFDNTAGSISDQVMQHLAIGARIIVCGTASVSHWNPPPLGPRVERALLTKRARMQGFLMFDHMDTYDSYVQHLADLVRSGYLKYQEDISQGLESAPDAIASLYRGENLGKRLIRL